jgi:opacity protein-like surface antigen
MMRIARAVAMFFAMILCWAPMLHAQPAAAAASADTSVGYAEINAGATLGHKSDVSFGGEGGYRLMPNLFVFGEVGHIGNAASSDLEARANSIANSVGATADVIAKVNYYDFGVRYYVRLTPSLHTYATTGFGGAHVTNQTTLSVNGAAVPPESLGVQFGSDLNGSENTPFFMLGFGADVTFHTRYFADVSYRYGRAFSKTDDAGNIVLDGLNTNRVQVGLGIRF